MDAYQQVIDRLSRFKRVLITTHVRPDGDAIGSTAALALALKQKGIEFDLLLLSHLPRKYNFLYTDAGLMHVDVEQAWPAELSMDRYDALLVLDTGTWSQLPGLKDRVQNWPRPKLVIDHHLTQESWADIKLVDTSAGACGEIVEELLMQWGVEFTPEIAQALFVAIVSDTGWFMFSNTRPQTLRLAAKLMEAGVNTDRIYQLLYQNERPERVALQTRALASLELLHDGKLAVMTIKRSDFIELNAHVNDTENLINIPLQIRSVEGCILFIEPVDSGAGGAIRVSFRSKGQIDVAKLAEQFGGGGHARASGAKFSTTLDQARARVLNAVRC